MAKKKEKYPDLISKEEAYANVLIEGAKFINQRGTNQEIKLIFKNEDGSYVWKKGNNDDAVNVYAGPEGWYEKKIKTDFEG